MSFLFGKGSGGGKNVKPAELVKALKDGITTLTKEKDKSKLDKASEEVAKCLLVFKQELLGEGEPEPNQEVITQLANEVYQHDLVPLLILNLVRIEFEVRSISCTLQNATEEGYSSFEFVLQPLLPRYFLAHSTHSHLHAG
eukprot:TRINITY_DN5100_c0_g1_i1.p1 TRINITY_DN5100_c0_g1~~TRINITY_DN5100_c0_g1_i1.p1  ORF type:complete len:141 (+),score=35.84 TRINITY_DN5100_c0_g1_i1:47-469(+)